MSDLSAKTKIIAPVCPTTPLAARDGDDNATRVMVVDDSSIVRGIVTRTLEAAPRIKVVASVANGAQAIKMLAGIECDVIVLDIEMPELDGISALPQLLAINPNVKIIMSSTLTRRGAEISLKAISLGAADYVAKPSSNIGAADAFRAELLGKVQAYGARARLHDAENGAGKY